MESRRNITEEQSSSTTENSSNTSTTLTLPDQDISDIALSLSSITFENNTNPTNDSDNTSTSIITTNNTNSLTTTNKFHPAAATYLHPLSQQPIPSQILEEAKILICDDEKTTLLIARRLLERNGYKQVHAVSSAAEALDALKNDGPFDLVLSDIYMPGGMNGHELIQEIRRLSKSLPIIMMSSSDEFDTVRECLYLGADHYILKPLRSEELKGIWQVILRRRREMEVVQMLENEKRKTQHLQVVNNKLHIQITTLRHEKNHAIHESVSILIGNLNEIQLKRLRSPVSQAKEFSIAEEVILNILKQFEQSLTFHEALLEHLSEGSPIAPSTKSLLKDRLSTDSDQLMALLAPASIVESWPAHTSVSPSELASWEFSVFDVAEDELLPLIENMYDGLGLLDAFEIPRDKFRNFLWEVKSHYCPSNPYHNFFHAFDVTQSVYAILRSGNGERLLTNIEMIAILTAALIHDVDHQGLNNVYQTNSWSHLAIRYNDRSVLENHHCSLGFFLLMKPHNYFLSHLSLEDKNRFRHIVVNSVLATDMAQHHDILVRAESTISAELVQNQTINSLSVASRTLLCQLILKSADVGNPAKPWEQVVRWALCVQMEFYNQGDRESSLGMPVAPFMVRPEGGKGLEGLTPASLAKGQVFFSESIVLPLLQYLVRFLPKCVARMDLLNNALTQWKCLAASTLPSLGAFLASSKISTPIDGTLSMKAEHNPQDLIPNPTTIESTVQ